MKYELNGNVCSFIIDLNYEILSILQKEADPKCEWISFINESYVNRIKNKLDMNSKSVIDMINFFKENSFPFGEMRTYCDCIDSDYNILDNYKKWVDNDVKDWYKEKLTRDFSKIKELEEMCKLFFNSINYNDIYNLMQEDCNSYLKDIREYLDNEEYRTRLTDFYGKQLGKFLIICSFVAGNFGSLVNDKQVFVRKFIIDEDNHILLNPSSILPFYFHEFSHPYISELIYKYKGSIKNFDKHFEKLNLSKEMAPYPTSVGYLNEILTRANETYLVKKYMPDKIDIYI